MSNVLYRMYRDDGQLLYVGATKNFPARVRAHAQIQQWWDEVCKITLERFDTFEELRVAERLAIETEDCIYNVMHTQPFVTHSETRRPKGEGSFYLRRDGMWIGRIELPIGPDGKRRHKYVSSRNRDAALQKFESAKAALL